MPDGLVIPGGPGFSGHPQPPDVPCDPTGDAWRGEPGPPGPPGPAGPPGSFGAGEAPVDGFAYGRVNAVWQQVVPITQLGTGVGQVPMFVSSGAGNLPMLSTSNRLIFRRQNPTVGNSTDFQFDRDTSSAPAGTPGGINRVIGVNSTIGANNAESEVGILITMTSKSTSSSLAVNHYPLWIEATRALGAKGHLTGAVIDITDSTNLGTAASGVPNHLGMELNSSAAGLDDCVEPATFGGAGHRRLMVLNAGKAPGSTQPTTTYASGLVFGTTDSTTSISSAISFALAGSAARIISALDTRGAVSPDSNPVAAVRMSAGQAVDFNGGPALNSAPGAYLHYEAGTGRLYYTVGGVNKWSVDASGNVRAAGTITGSTTP